MARHGQAQSATERVAILVGLAMTGFVAVFNHRKNILFPFQQNFLAYLSFEACDFTAVSPAYEAFRPLP